MNKIDPKFFTKVLFTNEQTSLYLNNALKDIGIAEGSDYPEVKFTFCYNALIKGGIALLAKQAGVKVRSVPGHHVKIIETMAKLLNDATIEAIGNIMRTKRNNDFYGGGVIISKKESEDYAAFVKKVLKKF